ncbi:MAG: hypothetical protein ACOCZ6_00880 [Nanoarchaeota archaeon]
MLYKKGYFFVVDAIIALFVLVLGIVLALSFFSYETPERQVSFLSNNIMEFLYTHRIKDINSEYLGPKRQLHKNENITNLDNRLLVQLGEFYYRAENKSCYFCKQLIRNSLSDVSGDFLAQGYSYAFYIEEELIYNETRKPLDEGTVLIPSKTVISGIYNETELWGPYRVEVRTWR